MMIGKFSDFMDTLSEETVMSIVNDANEKAEAVAANMGSADKGFAGTQIGVISYTIALELLGTYHAWLETL